MKYAKLINGFPTFASNPILHDGLWHGNPPGEIYLAEGYKPVQYSEPPDEAPSGYQWVETWVEASTKIIQGWELVQVPITEDEALVYYANELTGKQGKTLEEASENLIKIIKENN